MRHRQPWLAAAAARASRRSARHGSPASTATATTSSSRRPRPRCRAPTTGTCAGVAHVDMVDHPAPWHEVQARLAEPVRP
ncbi:MAG: hypothetical protein MZW92_55790 [Comamonadaceae bacterium]|nr:hypothetical protein [Comamonadaceae bacterium]